MKKRIAALLALLLCLCLTPFVSAENVAADYADLYVSLVPVETMMGDVALEIDIEVRNGQPEQFISTLEFRYENTLIASVDRVYGQATAWAMSAPLGMSLGGMAQEMEVEVNYIDFSGMSVSRYAMVSADAAAPRFDFKRTADKTVVAVGEKVELSYIIKNEGSVVLEDLEIYDDMNGVGQVGVIDLLFPGDMRELTRSVEVTADTVSQPYVTYHTMNNPMQSTLMLEKLPIVISRPQLDVMLKSDVAYVQPGESVTLVCSVVNKGNVSFDNVSISDANVGVIIEGARIEAGKAYSWNKVIKPVSTQDYLFVVKAIDTNGAIYTANSNIVGVEVAAAIGEQEETFEVSVTANTNVLSAPGEVTFNFLLRNTGEQTAPGVTIYDAAGNVLTQLQNLESGDKMVTVPIKIEKSGDYAFAVDATLAGGVRVQRQTEPVHVDVASVGTMEQPQETHVIETAPPTQPPAAVLPGKNAHSLLTPWLLMLIIFIALLIVACIVVLILLQLRALQHRREEEEMDAQYAPPVQQPDRRRELPRDPYEMRDEISRAARQYSRPVQEAPESAPMEEEDELPTVYKERGPQEPTTRRNQ